MKAKKKVDPKPISKTVSTQVSNAPDAFHAKLAFDLSLGFWLPLFNIGLCILAVIFAMRAVRCIWADPKQYGGMKYAVAALVISITSLVVTLIGVLIYAAERFKCGNVALV